MKTAFALYDGFSILDFASMYEPIARLEGDCQTCAPVTDVYDSSGLHFYPTCLTQSLSAFDRVIIPGGAGALEQLSNPGMLEWLATARGAGVVAAVNEGVALAAAAGLANGRRAAVRADLAGRVGGAGVLVDAKDLVVDGSFASAFGDLAGRRLTGLLLQIPTDGQAEGILAAGEPAAPVPVTGTPAQVNERRATVKRETGETQVEVRLEIDGTGQHQVSTGLPFFDHMLVQLAVHGLFDLYVQAQGDLQIDPHHTVEDVGLTLGAAFQQALGTRAGIVRMASTDCPMDESLAWAAVDFSGRPYCVFQADWHGPSVGSLPTSLIAHFFESFAINARCNLHAAVRYGRDDHHQVEALFKAAARALCAATRIDPRRAGQVPSSKGKLF